MIDKRKLKSRPIHVLKDLVIEEVSLVDRSANEGAEVLIWKRLDLDASILNSYSVEKLTAAMESINYAKIGTTPAELWDDFVAEFREAHNQKLSQRQKNPPKNLTQEQVEELRQKKPWSLSVASQEARKTPVGQGLWAMVEAGARERDAALIKRLKKMADDLEEIKRKRRNYMYKSLGEIATAIEKGEIKSQVDALKELDELRDLDIAKSDFAKSKERAIYDQCTDPAWDSLFNEFTKLPETIEQGEAFSKRVRASDNIVKVIEGLAEELIQKDGKLTKAKAIVKVLDRNPAWKTAYEMVTYG